MGGRPRKLENLHLIHGTHDASRHGDKPKGGNQAEPTKAHKAQAAPAWLPGNAKREWKRIAKELGPLADPGARAIMAQYCIMYCRLQEEPLAFSATDHAQFIRMQVEMGLTPQAKAKVRVADQSKKDADPDGWNDL